MLGKAYIQKISYYKDLYSFCYSPVQLVIYWRVGYFLVAFFVFRQNIYA